MNPPACQNRARIVPLCAALRCIVQHFAVIVPFNAVLCRAEKAARVCQNRATTHRLLE